MSRTGTLETMNRLMLALAVELDMHYEDDDLFVLGSEFALLKKGVTCLEAASAPVHPCVRTVIARFDRLAG